MEQAKPNFRDFLRVEFKHRAALNSLYSLRAFARDLKLSASQLSEVLSGRSGISPQNADRIAVNLGWDNPKVRHFRALVELERARTPKSKAVAQAKLLSIESAQEFKKLDLEYFSVISDWYHLAILELTKLNSFKPDILWIAKELDVSPALISEAVQRLKKLNLLIEKHGTWVDNYNYAATPSDIPSLAIRKYHKQILQSAMRSLNDQNVESRDFSSVALVFSKKDLKNAKSDIKAFRRNFCRKYSSSNSPDSLFCLSIQFFRPKGPGVASSEK